MKKIQGMEGRKGRARTHCKKGEAESEGRGECHVR